MKNTIEEVLCRFVLRENGCLEWVDAGDGVGYGRVTLAGTRERVHALMYRLLKGDLAEGMELHHKCGNKRCANLEHLCVLPKSLHTQVHNPFKEQCAKGHPYPENLRIKSGRRDCSACHREREYRRYLTQQESKVMVRGPYKNRGTHQRLKSS